LLGVLYDIYLNALEHPLSSTGSVETKRKHHPAAPFLNLSPADGDRDIWTIVLMATRPEIWNRLSRFSTSISFSSLGCGHDVTRLLTLLVGAAISIAILGFCHRREWKWRLLLLQSVTHQNS
jgi:hypothetical protein